MARKNHHNGAARPMPSRRRVAPSQI